MALRRFSRHAMVPTTPRVQQIRAIIERFRNGADEATSPYYRDLMLSTVTDLEAIAAEFAAGEPIDRPAERAA
jgi:hypothetical protein